MKHLLSLLLLCTFMSVYSQDYVDIFNVAYTNTPLNDFEHSDARTSVEEIAFDLSVPLKLNERTYALTGITANRTKVKLDPFMPYTSLTAAGINLGLYKVFSEKWSATFMVIPRIAAEKVEFSRDNIQYAFLSLFTNKKHDRLKYKYGVYTNTEQYGMIVVPILGLYYKSPNSKFEANLNVPINGDANYKLNNKWWVGLRFDGLGTTYNLNRSSYSPNGAYASKTVTELVSYLRFKLSKSIYMNTKIGYAINRNYEVYDSNDTIDLALSAIYLGDQRTLLNERFSDGAIFKLELFYRIDL